MMKRQLTEGSRGQVLVQVALGLVVLLLVVGLAVDGGNVYAQRRAMQNAADAGALAGARVLREEGDAGNASIAAYDYAERNGADSDLTDVVVDVDAGTVGVTARNGTDTFLMGLAGSAFEFDTVDVAADAVAEVYSPPGFPHIVSFDEDEGNVRLSGTAKIDVGGEQLVVHSNKDIEVDGGPAFKIEPPPTGTYLGTPKDNNDLYDSLTKKTKPLLSPLRNFDHDAVSGDGTLEDEIDRLMDEGELVFADGREPQEFNWNPGFGHPQNFDIEESTENTGVIYIDGDINPAGNRDVILDAKGGLIIVNGEFNVTGNATFYLNGLLYVTGDLEFGGNPGSLNHGLWSEGEVWFHGTPESFIASEIVEAPMPPRVRLIR